MKQELEKNFEEECSFSPKSTRVQLKKKKQIEAKQKQLELKAVKAETRGSRTPEQLMAAEAMRNTPD